MVWNPQQYLKFSGHRLRPAVDLLMRIPDFPVRSVADLGAGAGNVTKLIKERWPDAGVVGVEGSSEMVAAGRKAAPEVEWQQQDLGSWLPAQKYDVIYSNAALHWLPDHAKIASFDPREGRTRRHPRGADAPQFRSGFSSVDRRYRAERAVAKSG
jgi:Trans-aconitate methyltransferase